MAAFCIAVIWTRYPETQIFSLKAPIVQLVRSGVIQNQENVQSAVLWMNFLIALSLVITAFFLVRAISKRLH